MILAQKRGGWKSFLPNSHLIRLFGPQVEVIELVNNGSGLGFGIIGGQQAGVIVKTILPDGVADRDGRLKPNDFILQVSHHSTFSLLGNIRDGLGNYWPHS